MGGGCEGVERRGFEFGESRGGVVEWLAGEDVTKFADPVELFDGATVEALGLRLKAEEEDEVLGARVEARHAFGDQEIAILLDGDFEIVIEGFGLHEPDGNAAWSEAGIEKRGVQAALQAVNAEERGAGEGEPLDGEELFGVDGLIGADEIGADVRDLIERLQTDRGIVGRDERMRSRHDLGVASSQAVRVGLNR